MAENKVTVIGGGFGGLSASASLQNQGFDVTLLEQHKTVGGVARTIEVNGYKFDFGPSWYLMPEVFERFFSQFDKEPSDYYELKELDPQFRVFWKDTDVVSFPKNRSKQKKLFEAYEAGAGDSFTQFMDESKEAYELGMNRFIYPNRSSVTDFIDTEVVKSARALGLFRESMQNHVSDYFEHKKLQQLILYNIVFLGGTPKQTPALYKLMSHATMKGVYHPIGGIGEVINALEGLCRELGVNIETDRPVEKIRGEKGDFNVTTSQGKSYNSDFVVSNADYQFTEQELLEKEDRQYDKEYWESVDYAPSAFLLYLGVNNELQELSHHTLVFPRDWDSHFESIQNHQGLPEEPAYYISSPSQTDSTVSPEGKSTLVVLVPIAPTETYSEERKDEFEQQIINDIDNHTGTSIDGNIEFKNRVCVSDFYNDMNRSNGTALGISHNRKQTSILRPNIRSKKLDGLYFTGGDTRPGIGMPMCLISGMHLSEILSSDARD